MFIAVSYYEGETLKSELINNKNSFIFKYLKKNARRNDYEGK